MRGMLLNTVFECIKTVDVLRQTLLNHSMNLRLRLEVH